MTSKTRPTLLFVDDDERVTRVLMTMFKGLYAVFSANSGADGLKIINGRHIDVIVTDQRMPGMSGIELLRKTRQQSPQTIRVLLTGYWDLTVIIGAIADGDVDRFLRKPWKREEMQAVVADCTQAALRAAEDKLGAHAASKVSLDSQTREEPDMLKQFMDGHMIFSRPTSSPPETLDIVFVSASTECAVEDRSYEDRTF